METMYIYINVYSTHQETPCGMSYRFGTHTLPKLVHFLCECMLYPMYNDQTATSP